MTSLVQEGPGNTSRLSGGGRRNEEIRQQWFQEDQVALPDPELVGGGCRNQGDATSVVQGGPGNTYRLSVGGCRNRGDATAVFQEDQVTLPDQQLAGGGCRNRGDGTAVVPGGGTCRGRPRNLRRWGLNCFRRTS